MPEKVPIPINISAPDAQTICITWDNGVESRFPVRLLRGSCPCAVCVDEITGQRRYFPEDVPADLRAWEARPVGRYALQLVWSDGHDQGLYTYEYLWQLHQNR